MNKFKDILVSTKKNSSRVANVFWSVGKQNLPHKDRAARITNLKNDVGSVTIVWLNDVKERVLAVLDGYG